MTDTTSAAPVAWRVHPFDYGIGHEGVYAMTMLEQQRDAWLRKGWKVEPLYVAPQVVVEPLTDEQISRISRAVLEAPAADGVALDAARYRMLRRGQHWSVINGVGDTLRAEELDAAIDAARSKAKEGGAHA